MGYRDATLRGVGGWLAFLVVSLAVLTPLTAIVSAGTDIASLSPGIVSAEQRRALVIFDVAECACLIAGCEYLAWRLAKVHRRSTVRVAVIGFWLLVAVPTLAEVVMVVVAYHAPAMLVAQTVVPGHARGAIWAMVWSAYLLRSVRVANTYAPDERIAAVFE